MEDEARFKELNATVALRKAEAELAKQKNKEAAVATNADFAETNAKKEEEARRQAQEKDMER